MYTYLSAQVAGFLNHFTHNLKTFGTSVTLKNYVYHNRLSIYGFTQRRLKLMARSGISVKQHLYPWLQSKRQWISQQVARLLEDNKPKNSIASLDGVRALACLSVITYHLSLLVIGAHIWKPVEPFTTGLILSGASGVTLFFVLSGFLLFLPYAQALLFERNWPSAWRFYLRRFFRIVPAYYVALFLIILLFPPQPTNQQYLQPAHTR